MRKTTILAVLALALMAYAPDAQAQGFLGKLKDKVKEKVNEKVDGKINDAVDGVVNGKKKEKTEKAEKEDNYDNSPAGEAGYQKSDFVAGATAFFFDDVKNEKVGEFPSMWDLVSGEEIEVATYAGEKVIKIGGWHTQMVPLMKEEYYLPEEFTLEYEVLTTGINYDSNNDHLNVIFLNEENDGEGSDGVMNFGLNQDGGSDADLYFVKPNGADGRSTANGATITKLVKKNTWTKVEMSFNKRALKIYVNGTRIFNIPNMKQPRKMKFRSVSNSDQRDYFFIRNIRLANGAVELYDKKESTNDVEKAMTETGKFVTNNILFETGKADLKAESMVEIQKVADYMLKNKNVRFEVQGHCDNQGSDKVNDPLSQKRAEAIVTALVKLGVDEWNLRAVGKGSHEPVADNSTEAGRAKNRRVEFIKK